MSREARQFTREEYADRLCKVVRTIILDGACTPESEGELQGLVYGVSPMLYGDLRRALTWLPSECLWCGDPFRPYFGDELCRDCRDDEEERAKAEKIRRQVMKEFGIKPGAESAGGGK